MYGVLGEDNSDVESIKVLIRRIATNDSLPVKGKGYGGCGEMLRKGAAQLRLFADLGMSRFVVCYDADGVDASIRYGEAFERIVKPSGVGDYLISIPVQELEAWLLADLPAVSRVITSWKPKSPSNPEGFRHPKEEIERLSRAANKKPRYSHAIHNPRVAKYLDLATVYDRCPSFRPFHDFVSRAVR